MAPAVVVMMKATTSAWGVRFEAWRSYPVPPGQGAVPAVVGHGLVADGSVGRQQRQRVQEPTTVVNDGLDVWVLREQRS